MINSKNIMSITDVNQNFSKAIKEVERSGQVVIFKNNKPRYVLYDIDQFPQIEMSDDEKILFVGKRILKEHKKAFEELAK